MLLLRSLFEWIFLNSSRRYLEAFLRRAASAIPPGARVLDAGAGDGRYRPLFAHTNYEATDFVQVNKRYVLANLDFIADLKQVPAAPEVYDVVICTQVLEHMNEPGQMLAELHRVLKPQGELWLSAPLFYAEHEAPYDYFRYTQYGLRYLLEQAGFQIVQLEWLEGYYGTLSYQSLTAALALPLSPAKYGGGLIGGVAALCALLLKPLLALGAILTAYLDLRYKQTSSGQCKNYALVARKVTPALSNGSAGAGAVNRAVARR
jgi:SAM-dependent methyltransferase